MLTEQLFEKKGLAKPWARTATPTPISPPIIEL
jgi:hypothetical protein